MHGFFNRIHVHDSFICYILSIDTIHNKDSFIVFKKICILVTKNTNVLKKNCIEGCVVN